MSTSIDVKWHREGGVAVAGCRGRIDSGNAENFQGLIEAGRDPNDEALILDFEGIEYISSAGLRVLLVLARRFSESGQGFSLCSLSEHTQEIVAVSGFDRLIPVYDTRTAAISEIGGS